MAFEPIDFDGDHPRVGSLFLAGWQSLVGNFSDWFQTTAVAIGVMLGLGVLGALAAQTEEPLIAIIIILVAIVGGNYIQYGFARTALSIARGTKPTLNGVWRPERLAPYVMFQIILSCLLFGSLVIPIIGSILVLASAIYAPFFILDNRGSGMTGLWLSVRASVTSSRLLWQLLLIMFAVFVVASSAGATYLMIALGALAGFGSGSTGVAAIGIGIALILSLAVFLGAVIIVLSAAATAYIHLDSIHEHRDES